MDREGTQRLDQERAVDRAVQSASAGEGQGRVQAHVSGPEPQEDVQFAGYLRGKWGIAGGETQPSDPHRAARARHEQR